MSVKQENHKETKTTKQNLRYLRDKYREKVKGIFRFHEVPGGSMSFVYKEFAQDPVERYDMIDGEIYTIPLGVARHLNKNGWYPEYEHVKGEAGTIAGFGPTHTMRLGKQIRRFSFQSLEFVDIEDITPAGKPLVTVESAL